MLPGRRGLARDSAAAAQFRSFRYVFQLADISASSCSSYGHANGGRETQLYEVDVSCSEISLAASMGRGHSSECTKSRSALLQVRVAAAMGTAWNSNLSARTSAFLCSTAQALCRC